MSDSQFYDTQDQADKPRGIHMQDPIGRAHEEISRLSKNNQVLFDLLPDMLFIIKDNLVIERMNQAALERFGNQERGSCYQVIFGLQQPCAPEYCPFQAREGENPYGRIWEQKIHDNFFVEYSYVPFEGYQQDNLVLVVLKDVTKQKQHEQELERFNQNIEQVLKEKIQDLKQSEAERQQLYQELNYLKKEALPHTGQEEMLGDSMPIRELRETIYQVAPSDATVLITGESGTGKELVADMLYMQSHRVGKPYLKFNCAAVTESLLESELFGYEKGDFTGAKNTRKGKFEEAHTGTIFLDEIGNISARMQAGLLRVLQDGEIVRVGANKPISVDVRVIAATNADLEDAVQRGDFREDLYYRLNVINLRQAPLRKRKEDIPVLATNFLVKYRERFKKDVTFLPQSVMDEMLDYDWPGNVRELENAMQRAVLLSRNGIITSEDLGLESMPQKQNQSQSIDLGKYKDLSLKESLSKLEAEIIYSALRENPGRTIEEVCERLGVGRTTLYDKMKRHGICLEEHKGKNGHKNSR